MIVNMWMTRDLVTVEPTTSIVEAAAIMAKRDVRRLLVVAHATNGLGVLGIISSADLFRAFPANVNPFAALKPNTPQPLGIVEQFMSKQLFTVTPEAPIEEAARVMRDHKVGMLPVVRSGALVGVITEADVFRAFLSIFESVQGGVRITFDVSKGEDTFALLSRVISGSDVRVASLISSRQENRPVCVVRLTGSAVEKVVEDLWKSGHQVLSVVRLA